jgi:hypothetical protein
MTTRPEPTPLADVISAELDAVAERREEPDWKEVFGSADRVQQALEEAKRKAAGAFAEPAVSRSQKAAQHREWEREFEAAWRVECNKARRESGTPAAQEPQAAPQPDVPPPQPTPAGAALDDLDPSAILPPTPRTKGEREQLPLQAVRKQARDMDLTGLAISGGGIRSATFALGVLQALADLGLLKRFDYLSTVSGGGYIGSWLAAWIKREGSVHTVEKQLRGSRVDQARGRLQNNQPIEQEPAPVSHLRSYSNYLAPRLGLGSGDSWVLLSSYVRNFVLNQAMFIATLMAVLILPRLAMVFYDWDGDVGLSHGERPWLTPAYAGVGVLTAICVVVATWYIARSLWRLRRANDEGPRVIQTGVMKVRGWILVPLVLGSFLVGWFAWDDPRLTGDADSRHTEATEGSPRTEEPRRSVRTYVEKMSKQQSPRLRAALTVGTISACFFGGLYLIISLFVYWGSWGRGACWVLSGAVAGFVGGAILGAILYEFYHHACDPKLLNVPVAAGEAAGVVTFGPPIALLVFSLGTFVHVGLMGESLSDAEREWWGSLSGYVLQWAGAWFLVCGLALFSVPLLILAGSGLRAVLAAGWLGTALGGVLAARSPRTGKGPPNRPLEILARAAPYVFILGLAAALSALLSVLLDDRPGRDVATPFVWPVQEPSQPATHVKLATPPTPENVPEDGARTRTRTTEFDLSTDEARIAVWRYWAGLFNTNGEDVSAEPLRRNEKSRSALVIKLSAWLGGLAAAALLLSWRVGVNTFSLSGIYGNRLIRCYLGASRRRDEHTTEQLLGMPANVGPPSRRPNPVTGFDPLDDMPLANLRTGPWLPSDEVVKRREKAEKGEPVIWPYRGPYLLVNTALNLVHGDELAWQERKAEAFLLSPEYCGSVGTDYQPLPGFADNLSLGKAVTISGAAASPNMGYHSSPAVTALLTLFNVRLGAWVGNPARRYWTREEPHMSVFLLFKELFGRTNRTSDYVYLSDGGHFENLGVYELVRRHCRFIVAIDGDQDGDYTFGDLGGLVRKCSSDLGVPIEIDVTPIKPGPDGYSKWHCAVGKVRYDCLDPQAVPGVLVYLKTSLTGDEPSDVVNYAVENPPFPHQSTADQFFTESQFESYRRLGYHVGHAVFDESTPGTAAREEMTDRVHRKIARGLFGNLQRRWFPPPPSLEENYLESVKGCIELEVAMRTDENLAHFSQTINPEVKELRGDASPAAAPVATDGAARARAEVHAVAEMLQVMEDAWLSVHLEGYYAHPLNRGWMSAFRRWANSDVFRKHWLALRAEFSQDFVRFCEQALRLDVGKPTAYNLSAVGELAGVAGWAEMRREFQAEWPDQQPLDALVAAAARFGDSPPAVWLLAVASSADPHPHQWNPDRYPCGVVVVSGDTGGRAFELFVWVRGAYRNLGIGRKCLNHIFTPDILAPLKEAGHGDDSLRVRLPNVSRPHAAEKMQDEMWSAFFFEFGFRKVDDPTARDLVLCRSVNELMLANQ